MSTNLSKKNNTTIKPQNKSNRNKLSLPMLQMNSNALDKPTKNKKNSVTIKTNTNSCEKEENKLSESTTKKNTIKFSQASPYQLPSISPRNKTETSQPNNIEKIIEEYNKIKLKINKFNKASENNLNSTESIQEKNTILLKYVSKLNNILESILSLKLNKKYASSSKKYLSTELSTTANQEVKDNNNKLLKTCIAQYNVVYNKYKKYSNENFLDELREKIKKYSESISDLEKKNRQLQTSQQRSEYALKKNKSSQNMDSDLKSKTDDVTLLTNQLNKLIEKSSKNQEKINYNETQLNKLIKKEQTLTTVATDIYEIKSPDKKIEVKKVEQVDKELCNKKEEITKTLQLQKISFKKTNEKLSNNKKTIKELELQKNYKNNEKFEKTNKLYLLNEQLSDLQKKIEADKKNSEKNKNKNTKKQSVSKSVNQKNNTQTEKIKIPKVLTTTSSNTITDNENNENTENNSPYIQEEVISSNNEKKKEYVNSNNNDTESNNEPKLTGKDSIKKQLDKETIIKNLEEQNEKEKNYGQSRLINNPSSSINITRSKLKPNFSFTTGIMNKINNSKTYKSESLNPLNNSQHESNYEIKEDVLNDNINDDTINIKNSKTLDNENSKNNLAKSNENAKRENALNTFVYNQSYGEENNENKESKKDILIYSDNNKEQVFIKGVKMEKSNGKKENIAVNNKNENENRIEGVVLDVNEDKEDEKNIKNAKKDDVVEDEIIEE